MIEIADELVPLAGTVSEATGTNAGNAGAQMQAETAAFTEEQSVEEGMTEIADEAVPLAAAAEKKASGKSAMERTGMFSAALAAFLLLFKRKKDEEEEQS